MVSPRRWGIVGIALATVGSLATTGGTAAVGVPKVHSSVAVPNSQTFAYVPVGGAFSRLSKVKAGPLTNVGGVPTVGSDDAVAAAISPNGNDAVFVGGTNYAIPVTSLRHTPTSEPNLDFNAFSEEGDSHYSAFATGIAINNSFGVVSLASQGLAQIRKVGSSWQIDTRVQSPGLNEGTVAHQPGWIRAGGHVAQSNWTFDGVAMSNVPLPNGKYLALGISRNEEAVAGYLGVFEGIGTAKPKWLSTVSLPDLNSLSLDDYGNGGMAFSPATATRAVLATPSGFDTINLSKPRHPKVVGRSVSGVPHITSVAIAPDADHVALAAGAKIGIYQGLLAGKGPLTPIGKVTPTPSDNGIEAISYLANGSLLAEHSGFDSATTMQAWYATTIKKAQSAHPVVGSSRELAGEPADPNGLSVYPSIVQPRLTLSTTHIKLHKNASIHLKVKSGYGSYTFKVVGGHLPAGLRIRKHKIVGTPKNFVTKAVALRGVNQYGGAVFAAVAIVVT